jgi:enamine deaminase RidA (YjgF/YER057c/UK114 family)
MNIDARLTELGLSLPAAPKPIAAYIPSRRAGDLLFVSGQLPWRDGKLIAAGKVPSAVTIEQAQSAAAQCALLGLSILAGEINNDWERLAAVIRIGVFVQSEHDFTEQAKVANGASELLQQILGDTGRHSRAAVGVNALPLNASVEVEFLFQLK